ncbi:MAG: hypothetical protein ABIR32_08355 [Ilumatobacteraceae bacterium]
MAEPVERTETTDATERLIAAPRANADQLAEMEEERRFLLRSLADLERERQAGDVDEPDYEALSDGYTSRAAAVLRAIEAGKSRLAPKKPRDLRRLAVMTGASLGVAALLIVLVLRFAAPRGSNDTITGGTDSDRVAALLSEGRSALNTADYATASNAYQQVLEADSRNVEAKAYLGWVLANSAQNVIDPTTKANTLEAGKQALVDATEIDSTYADSYCFLAIIAAQFDNDIPTATTREQECRTHNPSSEMDQLVTEFATKVIASANGPATSDPVASDPVTSDPVSSAP